MPLQFGDEWSTIIASKSAHSLQVRVFPVPYAIDLFGKIDIMYHAVITWKLFPHYPLWRKYARLQVRVSRAVCDMDISGIALHRYSTGVSH